MTDSRQPGSDVPGPHDRGPREPGTQDPGALGEESRSEDYRSEDYRPEDSLGDQPERSRSRRSLSALKETVLVVAIALVISLLVKTFLVQAFFIPSSSMEDTLEVGDRVLVSRLAPGPLDLHRGDIVVFEDPGGWLRQDPDPDSLRQRLIDVGEFVGLLPANTGSHLIKRVIAMPGDTVSCCGQDGRVSVNGVSIDEPYVIDGAVPSEIPFEITVPEGHLFVLGDNRPNSADSRYHQGAPGGGTVPIENVVGVAQVTIWPLDRLGILRNPADTFADVPEAS